MKISSVFAFGLSAGSLAVACSVAPQDATGVSADAITSCTTASQCTGPLPQICERCSNGTSACAHHACANYACTIEICPSPEVGTHYPFPQVPDQSGQILNAPELVTILASNDASTGSDTAANLRGFSSVLPSSTMWADVSSEYALGSMTASSAVLTGPAMAAGAQSKAAIQTYVQTLIGKTGPAPNGHSIYLLYLPTGSSLSTADFGSSCGVHFQYPGTATDAIAVVARCGTEQAQETQLGQLTRDASHEIVEAATNPRQGGYNFKATMQPGVSNIWSVWNGGDVELGDLCEGTRMLETLGTNSPPGGWEFQRIWSNNAAAIGGDPCIPAAADPYYSVSMSQGWYMVPPGQAVNIPFSGWSASATGNWFLNKGITTEDSSGTFVIGDTTITSTLGNTGTPAGCGLRYGMNGGDTGTLTVTAPATAAPGDYVVLKVVNFDEQGSLCNPPMTQDFQHFWPVGVYVGSCPAGTTWNAAASACKPVIIHKCTTPEQCCIQSGGVWTGKFCE